MIPKGMKRGSFDGYPQKKEFVLCLGCGENVPKDTAEEVGVGKFYCNKPCYIQHIKRAKEFGDV